MKKLVILLLVEDNGNDIELTERIIRAVDPAIQVVVHSTGEEALIYMQATTEIPQLILLDIGLPKMDGIEFIRQMKNIKHLQAIPVVILTGLALDIARAHAADIAAGYIVKPIEVRQFKKQLKELGFDL